MAAEFCCSVSVVPPPIPGVESLLGQPQIVVLDQVDLTAEQHAHLRALGSVTVHHDNPAEPEETYQRARDADILVLGWTSLDAGLLARLPRLKMISVWATGYDYIDVHAASDRGVVIANVPGYAGRAVAELAIGLILGLVRRVIVADRSVREGRYSWQGFQGAELPSLTLGLVGLGDIGGTVARLAHGLGMPILGHVRDPQRVQEIFPYCEFTSLDDLLRRSDVVSLHLPLSAQTERLIGAAELASMKPSAYLVNTARAGLVDQQALTTALKGGRIAGAGIDDMHVPDAELTQLPNVILTPHIGFLTTQALERKGDICIGNVSAFLAGRPDNVVS